MNLLREDFAESATEDGEVLREHADLATVNGAESRNHTVGEGTVLLEAHAVGAVARQHVEFGKRALIKQVLEALTRGHLAAVVVLGDGLLPTAQTGSCPAAFEVG